MDVEVKKLGWSILFDLDVYIWSECSGELCFGFSWPRKECCWARHCAKLGVGDVLSKKYRRSFSCKCEPGICQPVHCPPSSRIQVLHKGNGTPGNCCDDFQCIHDGSSIDDNSLFPPAPQLPLTTQGSSGTKEKKESDSGMEQRSVELGFEAGKKPCLHESGLYKDGQKWCRKGISCTAVYLNSLRYPNLCTECGCEGGLTFCRKMSCPQIPDTCTWVDIPAEECCPLCLGCVADDGTKVRSLPKNPPFPVLDV